MKVIKEGHWNNPWHSEIVCTEKQCEAVLEVKESDVKVVDYSSSNNFFVTCPVCGSMIYISGENIPLRVQKLLNNKRKYSSSSGWD